MPELIIITDSNLGDGSDEHAVLDGEFELRRLDLSTEDEVIEATREAVGLLVQWAPITERVLAELPRLRAVVRYGIGLDNIDLAAAERHGVRVSNVDDYCLDEVADHAAAAIYAHNRRLTLASRRLAGTGWTLDGVPTPLPPSEDAVGVAGLGRIGRATTKRLRALGFTVHGWDPFVDDVGPDVTRHRTLTELASAVRHLTLHMPLTEETRHLVDAEVLAALGAEGHLVNTARGGLVDEEALLTALRSGGLGFASLDVLATEPPTGVSAEIAADPRVVATPHLAYLSSASLPALRSRAAARLRDLLRSAA